MRSSKREALLLIKLNDNVQEGNRSDPVNLLPVTVRSIKALLSVVDLWKVSSVYEVSLVYE